MPLTGIIVISTIILVLAYRFYGRIISIRLEIDDKNPTPAHTKRDNVDYMPGKMPVVLGHHFASIAGAGPIVGPIIAVAFGWIPALLWILVGGIFFGAVHDITSMMASIRHQGKSIGEVIERYIGISGKNLFMTFAFATLILIIAVFVDIVAKTFVSVPSAASASLMFMVLALIFGWVMTKSNIPFWLLSTVGVIFMYGLVYLGTIWPLHFDYFTWVLILLVYCFLAAIAPVWILLQPRDYLNSFLLYGMMLLGIIGIFVANPTVEMTTEVHMHVDNLGYIFPVLFVTIACGAISGFHSLVASGTTSKQLDRETDARRIGFGGMLIESLLAVVSVGTVIVLSREDYQVSLSALGPVTLYSNGLGSFISSIGIPISLAISFVALTVSAFAVTTLDTCTRLGRFVFQEYFEKEIKADMSVLTNKYVATLITVGAGGLLGVAGWQRVWPVFGSANQLLAAIALMSAAVWLKHQGKNIKMFTIPMIFMFTVTMLALIILVRNNLMAATPNYPLVIIGSALLVLAVILAKQAFKELTAKTTDKIA